MKDGLGFQQSCVSQDKGQEGEEENVDLLKRDYFLKQLRCELWGCRRMTDLGRRQAARAAAQRRRSEAATVIQKNVRARLARKKVSCCPCHQNALAKPSTVGGSLIAVQK